MHCCVILVPSGAASAPDIIFCLETLKTLFENWLNVGNAASGAEQSGDTTAAWLRWVNQQSVLVSGWLENRLLVSEAQAAAAAPAGTGAFAGSPAAPAKAERVFKFEESELVKAIRSGSWVLLDNVNTCPPEVLERLNSLLEESPMLALFESGKDVCLRRGAKENAIHDNFRIFATSNPTREGSYQLSDAFLNRVMRFYIAPLDEAALMALRPRALPPKKPLPPPPDAATELRAVGKLDMIDMVLGWLCGEVGYGHRTLAAAALTVHAWALRSIANGAQRDPRVGAALSLAPGHTASIRTLQHAMQMAHRLHKAKQATWTPVRAVAWALSAMYAFVLPDRQDREVVLRRIADVLAAAHVGSGPFSADRFPPREAQAEALEAVQSTVEKLRVDLVRLIVALIVQLEQEVVASGGGLSGDPVIAAASDFAARVLDGLEGVGDGVSVLRTSLKSKGSFVTALASTCEQCPEMAVLRHGMSVSSLCELVQLHCKDLKEALLAQLQRASFSNYAELWEKVRSALAVVSLHASVLSSRVYTARVPACTSTVAAVSATAAFLAKTSAWFDDIDAIDLTRLWERIRLEAIAPADEGGNRAALQQASSVLRKTAFADGHDALHKMFFTTLPADSVAAQQPSMRLGTLLPLLSTLWLARCKHPSEFVEELSVADQAKKLAGFEDIEHAECALKFCALLSRLHKSVAHLGHGSVGISGRLGDANHAVEVAQKEFALAQDDIITATAALAESADSDLTAERNRIKMENTVAAARVVADRAGAKATEAIRRRDALLSELNGMHADLPRLARELSEELAAVRGSAPFAFVTQSLSRQVLSGFQSLYREVGSTRKSTAVVDMQRVLSDGVSSLSRACKSLVARLFGKEKGLGAVTGRSMLARQLIALFGSGLLPDGVASRICAVHVLDSRLDLCKDPDYSAIVDTVRDVAYRGIVLVVIANPAAEVGPAADGAEPELPVPSLLAFVGRIDGGVDAINVTHSADTEQLLTAQRVYRATSAKVRREAMFKQAQAPVSPAASDHERALGAVAAVTWQLAQELGGGDLAGGDACLRALAGYEEIWRNLCDLWEPLQATSCLAADVCDALQGMDSLQCKVFPITTQRALPCPFAAHVRCSARVPPVNPAMPPNSSFSPSQILQAIAAIAATRKGADKHEALRLAEVLLDVAGQLRARTFAENKRTQYTLEAERDLQRVMPSSLLGQAVMLELVRGMASAEVKYAALVKLEVKLVEAIGDGARREEAIASLAFAEGFRRVVWLAQYLLQWVVSGRNGAEQAEDVSWLAAKAPHLVKARSCVSSQRSHATRGGRRFFALWPYRFVWAS